MSATRKVVILASVIALECLLAGMACAAELFSVTGGAAEAVETILAAVTALCVGVLGTFFVGVRWILRADKNDEDHPLFRLYASQLQNDTDLKSLLKYLAEQVEGHDKQLKPMVEDYMLRKAAEKTGRPWED